MQADAMLRRGLAELVDGAGLLGAVLGLSHPDGTRRQWAAGHADLERTQPLTYFHAFAIGSQTKMFTAAAIMTLAQAGRLDLDAPAASYCPEFATGAVTIAELLCHVSGLADGCTPYVQPDPPLEAPVPAETIIHRGLSGEVAPRASRGHFAYNNGGYILLGQIIAQVTGLGLAEAYDRLLLRPLGLAGTGLAAAGPLRACGYYRLTADAPPIDITHGGDLHVAGAAGAMVSTAGDLLAFAAALLDGRAGFGPGLSRALPMAVPTPGELPRLAYGPGLECRSLAGLACWGHGGVTLGHLSMTLVEPLSGRVATLLTNHIHTRGTDLTRPALLMQMLLAGALHID